MDQRILHFVLLYMYGFFRCIVYHEIDEKCRNPISMQYEKDTDSN